MADGMTYNINQTQQMVSEGKIKSFATFIYLKSLYKNGCYFKWSIKSIAAKTGLSRQYIAKQLRFFKESGWVREHGGNLVFRSFKDFDTNKEKTFSKIHIDKSDGVKEIVSKLRLDILKNKDSGFRYLRQIRHDYYSPHPYLKKLAKRRLKDMDPTKLPKKGSNYTVSMTKLGKMFGCSPAMAHKELSRYKSSGEVTCIAGKKKFLMRAYGADAKSVVSGVTGSYWANGSVYQTACNQYIFREV